MQNIPVRRPETRLSSSPSLFLLPSAPFRRSQDTQDTPIPDLARRLCPLFVFFLVSPRLVASICFPYLSCSSQASLRWRESAYSVLPEIASADPHAQLLLPHHHRRRPTTRQLAAHPPPKRTLILERGHRLRQRRSPRVWHRRRQLPRLALRP